MNSELLTPKAAAERASVSPSLIYQWCRDQLLPHYRLRGKGRRGRILIAPADLQEFMQQCRVDRNPLLGDPR